MHIYIKEYCHRNVIESLLVCVFAYKCRKSTHNPIHVHYVRIDDEVQGLQAVPTYLVLSSHTLNLFVGWNEYANVHFRPLIQCTLHFSPFKSKAWFTIIMTLVPALRCIASSIKL